jgi:hypothetical protein
MDRENPGQIFLASYWGVDDGSFEEEASDRAEA